MKTKEIFAIVFQIALYVLVILFLGWGGLIVDVLLFWIYWNSHSYTDHFSDNCYLQKRSLEGEIQNEIERLDQRIKKGMEEIWEYKEEWKEN